MIHHSLGAGVEVARVAVGAAKGQATDVFAASVINQRIVIKVASVFHGAPRQSNSQLPSSCVAPEM